MKVDLITYTQHPTKVCAAAAWVCTHESFATEAELHPDKSGPLLRRVIKSGHESVLEHAAFTFAIEGISRACSHQLVRHRIASFSQQSQRYVTSGNFNFVTPQSVVAVGAERAYQKFMVEQAAVFYDELLAAGVPAEDARFVLPNAATTKLVMTMNARELRHFFRLRLCKRAQWEIREMAEIMLAHCQKVAPVLFEDAGPDCGNCKEANGCGKRGGQL